MNGVAVWLNASRAHGKPPNGTRPRSSSWPTHSAAVHTGQAGSRETSATAAPSGRKYRASIRERTIHASGPMLPIPSRTGMKNAAPQTNPSQAPVRAARPRRARVSSATPIGASGVRSNGGNASHIVGPAATASRVRGHPARPPARSRARTRPARSGLAGVAARPSAPMRPAGVRSGRVSWATSDLAPLIPAGNATGPWPRRRAERSGRVRGHGRGPATPLGPESSHRRWERGSVFYWMSGPFPGPTPRPIGRLHPGTVPDHHAGSGGHGVDHAYASTPVPVVARCPAPPRAADR